MNSFFLFAHSTNTIDFEKEKILPLTKIKVKIKQRSNRSYVCGEKFLKKFANDKNYQKVIDHFHFTGKCRGEANSICNSKCPMKFLHFFTIG